jgi:CheY-like chemotaxis protein
MIDFRAALCTTVLLVDDDVRHLELRTRAMRMSGFSVVNASSPLEAISILNEDSSFTVDVAVLDYEMPLMTGCLLADYLKTRYPQLKTILYSGSDDIPEDQMRSVDVFVPKSSGVAALMAKIAEFGSMETVNRHSFVVENASVDAVN